MENNKLSKWRRHRWSTTIGISHTVLTILASAFFLLLNFTIVCSKQLDSNITLITTLPAVEKSIRKAMPTLGSGEF
jgi:hypothetical protein